MFIIIIMNRIKELREDFGLTQTELAKEINTSQRNISRWEKDEIEMGANFAVTMAKYFNVSVEYLLGISNEDDLPALSNIVKNKKNPIADRPPWDIVTEKFIDEFKDLFSEKTFRQYALLYRAMDRDTRIFVLGYICSCLKSVGMNTEKVLK